MEQETPRSRRLGEEWVLRVSPGGCSRLQATGPSACSLLGEECRHPWETKGHGPPEGGETEDSSIAGSRVLGLSPENLLSALFSCWGSTLSSVLPRALQPHSAISVTCSFLESIFVCLGERKLNLVGGGDQDIYSVE